MSKDIVIKEDWTVEFNKELSDLNAEWGSIIDMSHECITAFQEKGRVVGMLEALTMLVEYNNKALVFEEKVRTINEANGEDITWL